jgi:lysophospholipase L1-like esterase
MHMTSYLVRCGQGFLVSLAGLLLLECSTRGLITLREDVRPAPDPWYVYSEELGWERRPNYSGSIVGMQMPVEKGYTRDFDSQGFFLADSRQIKAKQNPRILVFGDSSTFGWGVPSHLSYAEMLDRLLPDTSVINLGVNGYTSYQGYKALVKYLPELKPDIVVVSFNLNDRRYVLSPDDVDSDAKFHRDMTARRWEVLREKVYLYRLLRVLLSKTGLVKPGMNPEDAVADDVRKLTVRVPPEQYRQNLLKMAKLAKENNVALVFLVLKDNPVQTEHLRRGVNLLERSEFDEAIRELEIAVNLKNPTSDLARKYLATAYEKRGDVEEGKRAAKLSPLLISVHGGYPIYQDSEYNDIMRSVAKEYGIKLVDAGSALDKDASVYLDNCHPDKNGHLWIANLLYPAVGQIVAERQGRPRGMLSAQNNQGFRPMIPEHRGVTW